MLGPPSAAGSATTDGCDPDTEQQKTEPAPSENSAATGAPGITGTAQVGETLTADTAGIADEDGLDNAAFSYQWLADDADIQEQAAPATRWLTPTRARPSR